MTNEVKTCEVVVELPALPEGYHYTGEYRFLLAGELCSYRMSSTPLSQVDVLSNDSTIRHHAIEKDRWVPAIGDTVWYIHATLNLIRTYVWQPHHTELTENIYLFKTEAIAEIARSNIHALLTEADLNNMQ